MPCCGVSTRAEGTIFEGLDAPGIKTTLAAEPSKFCETYDFYQFPDPMLFRTVLAKAIAKLPIMTSWHCSVVGESLSGEEPY